jgi:Ku protein
VKGFQFEKDNYVQIEADEIEAIKLEANHVIDIVSFVPAKEIDGLYFNEPYYIAPSEEHGEEAFAVIREAMNEKDMVAVGRVIIGSREHMIALSPRGNGIVGRTLLYPYEVRKEREVFDRISDFKIDRELLDMVHQLMKSKAGALRAAEVRGPLRERATRFDRAETERCDRSKRGTPGRVRERHRPDGSVARQPQGQGRCIDRAPEGRR